MKNEIKEAFNKMLKNDDKNAIKRSIYPGDVTDLIPALKVKYNIPKQPSGDHYRYDYSFLDLSGINFMNLHPKNSSFYGSILDKSTFEGCCLCQADFTNASMVNCNMKGVEFRGNKRFKGATMTGIKFKNSTLQN